MPLAGPADEDAVTVRTAVQYRARAARRAVSGLTSGTLRYDGAIEWVQLSHDAGAHCRLARAARRLEHPSRGKRPMRVRSRLLADGLAIDPDLGHALPPPVTRS